MSEKNKLVSSQTWIFRENAIINIVDCSVHRHKSPQNMTIQLPWGFDLLMGVTVRDIFKNAKFAPSSLSHHFLLTAQRCYNHRHPRAATMPTRSGLSLLGQEGILQPPSHTHTHTRWKLNGDGILHNFGALRWYWVV